MLNQILFAAGIVIFWGTILYKMITSKVTLKQPLSYYLFILPQFIHIAIMIYFFQVPSIEITIIGAFIFIIGMIARHRTLNAFPSNYNISKIKRGNAILTKGVYSMVRHPLYVGTLNVYLGLTLLSFSIHGLLFYLIILLPSFILRIINEEKELSNNKAYQEYKKKVNMLIPNVKK